MNIHTCVENDPHLTTQQTWDVHLKLVQCWPNIADDRPTWNTNKGERLVFTVLIVNPCNERYNIQVMSIANASIQKQASA